MSHVIDCGTIFAARRIEADMERIERVRRVANWLLDIAGAEPERRQRINGSLDALQQDISLPGDVEWKEGA